MSGKKILYNGEEYADFSTIAQGVGEFTSNSGVKDPLRSNSEIFNDYANNAASGDYSHAEGSVTKALGNSSHAEGYETKALGNYSHVEGQNNYSNVSASHTEGYGHFLDSTYILNNGIDYSTLITDINAVSSGTIPTAGTVDIVQGGYGAHNEGQCNLISGLGAHIEGISNGGFGTGVHIEGKNNIGGGSCLHIEGFNNKNVIYSSSDTNFENPRYIQGRNSTDQFFSESAHIEGSNNLNDGTASHIEGVNNKNRKGERAHVEGNNNTLTYTSDTHVEGYNNTLTGTNTLAGILNRVHVEGVSNTIGAGAINTHVEGANNVVQPGSSTLNHIEGESNEIVLDVHHTHIEGANNRAVAGANYCHIAGQSNISVASHQTIVGRNCSPDGYALFIVGNGTINGTSSNAFTVSQTGVANAQSDVQIGGYSILENFAPAYDGTATYPADSFCTYLGKLYTNPSAITIAEPDFISSHWTETTLSTIQTGNSNSIGGLGTQIGGIWQELGPLTGSTGKVAVLETNVSNHESRITALEQGGSSTVDAIVTNSSDEYDTSTTYNVGDYCIYNNILYKCTTAVTAEATFDPDKWTATTVISVLNTLNQRLAALEALPNLDNEPL